MGLFFRVEGRVCENEARWKREKGFDIVNVERVERANAKKKDADYLASSPHAQLTSSFMSLVPLESPFRNV